MDAQQISEAVEARFRCGCQETLLRVRTCADGSRQFVRQCSRCGKCGKALKVVGLDPGELRRALPVDEGARDHWQGQEWAYRQQLNEQSRNAERAEWLEEYGEYLSSPEWRTKSAACLERDGYRCQARFSGCAGRANQAHHLTYDRLRNEPLFDLVSVCEPCHRKLHAHMREGGRRAA